MIGIGHKRGGKDIMTQVIRVLLIGSVLGLVSDWITLTEVNALGGARPVRIEPLADVIIGPSGIAMPLQRILLIQANSCYCAIKFIKAYTEQVQGEYSGEYFATYESWWQDDGTGDFSKSNVLFKRDDLWWRLPIGIGRLWLIMRYRKDIKCGPVTLEWWRQTVILWTPKKINEKVKTIHFAPTPWVSISEVNVRDPRIIWYYQKPDLPEIRIPIDQLWKHGDKKNWGLPSTFKVSSGTVLK